MEEELQKRNTDCVYFLASPLTCKKGVDCEYRHSEMARLNPRDCWYWVAGHCLNPTCTFRHPPIEAHSEVMSESAPLPYQCSVPSKTTNTPCYFYFNGFCNKGDRCSFLHGPDCSTTAGKSLKTASAVTYALPLEGKTSAGSDKESAPTETHLIPSETSPKAAVCARSQPKENLQLPAPNNVLERRVFPQISAPESEEPAVVGSDSLLPAEGFIQSRSHLCTDQSSEEQVDDHIEPEERWESSPGFDVLVDDKSEDLGYEDDAEFLLALDRERRELNSNFLGYDFEDPVEYDPTYPDNPSYTDAELLYERKLYDSHGHLDDEHNFEYIRKIPSCSRERMLDSILSQKRKPLPMELAVDERSGVDLRNYLRKRRVIDGYPISQLSRKHISSRLIGQSQERPRRHGSGRRLHGKLASEVGKSFIGSLKENGTLSNGAYQQGWHKYLQLNGSRQRYKEKRLAKRQFLSSEVSTKPVSRERRSTQECTTFMGPMTLAQIKKEERKDKENGNDFGNMGHSSRMSLADFQGPKSLSEILREKGRLALERDGKTGSS